MTKIRKALATDLDTIANFNLNLAMETENKILDKNTVTQGVKFLLENEKYGTYYVATNSEQIVGQAMYTYEWSDWRNGLFLWIQSVYVMPSHRKKGIFSTLYNEIKDICDNSSGICGIRLYAERENYTAHKTYENLGMTKCYYDMFEYEKKTT
ncbi:MAG: GNAT family N-acetyltransferase [Epulopiscium sp. Nele67-Bin001]|nr:MAG: GNAT family N-acetyltransferase [Epulopiscium sp. Nuni2H_MBin001]OON90979.1 MAG: GNAT family N-acetyltransferase [Epulopiscium sp. Nele67-Bin001]